MSETNTPPADDQVANTAPPEGQEQPADGAEGQEAEGEGKPAEQPQREREPWYAARIRKQGRENQRLQRELDQIRARLEAQQQPPPAQQQGNGQQPPAQQQRAPEQPRQAPQPEHDAAFEAVARSILDPGMKEYPDWQATMGGWEKAGIDLTSPDHRDLVGHIASLPDPHRMWYALAKDPDFAAELLDMTPRQQAAAIARFSPGAAPAASRAATPAPVASKAPPPAKPVAQRGSGVTGTSNLYDGNISMERFVAERAKAGR